MRCMSASWGRGVLSTGQDKVFPLFFNLLTMTSIVLQVVWDWLILSLTFYSVVMVPFNLAFNRSLNNDDITLLVIDSIVDLTFFIDIIFNFHTSFVGTDGAVIVDQVRGRLSNFSIIFQVKVSRRYLFDLNQILIIKC